MLYRGRIRVEIKNDDGTPIKPEYATRESVMKFIAESIPKLKTRQNRYVENKIVRGSIGQAYEDNIGF